jgi:hypothetical protein
MKRGRWDEILIFFKARAFTPSILTNNDRDRPLF